MIFAQMLAGHHGGDPRAVAIAAAGATFFGALVARSRAARRRDARVYRAVARVATHGGAMTPGERAMLAAIATSLQLTKGAIAEIDRELHLQPK